MKRFALLTLLLSLAGCAVGPNYHPPKMTVPPAFSAGVDPSYTNADTVAQWWKAFNDPELNRLVEMAVVSNHDLIIASNNLLQARALRLGAVSDAFPVVDGVASYNHEKVSRASFFNFPIPLREESLYEVGFDATWELDIFGRVRRNVESQTAQVQAAEASRRDVLVSLVAEIAVNYFQLRGAQDELQIQERFATNQKQTLDITQSRRDAGGGTELDVARADSEWNSTQAALPPLRSTAAHAIHRLSVLTGQEPNALQEELQTPQSRPELPAVIAIGDPAALLRRRPDIRMAERQLESATALIGVATAQLFPKVTFSGNLDLQATSISGLGGPASDTHNIGPSISWDLLDYGHIRSAIKAARANADAQLARYQQTVLTSLEETENALTDYGQDEQRSQYLTASVQSSRRAAQLAHERYESGATDFLAELDADRVALQSEDQLSQTRTQTALDLIALYKSLGGGWEP